MNKTFSIKTLGCKLNQYESSRIAGEFTGNGWEMRPFGENVDITIVNTCTVTDVTDKKCRGYIRQSARKSGSGKVIVTGCMAESCGDLKEDPSVSAVLGNREKDTIFHCAEKLLGNEADSGKGCSDYSKPLPVRRSRASIKIQDGCNNHCSYCIVPSVRGEPVSRDLHEIVEHAEKLIGEGYHELVLTGITIGKYNHEGMDLARLVERLIDLPGDYRIRITSIEPVDITDRLLELYTSEKICHHIHLPLQSGSDRILRLMNRRYSSFEYIQIVRRIKKLYPEISVGTDLIVGFPGEDETDFNDSIHMIREAAYAYMNCFPFSSRKGTPASQMAQNADSDTVRKRVEKVKEAADEATMGYRKQFIGKTLRSIMTRKNNSDAYTAVTGNYIKVKLENDNLPPDIRGEFRDVRILKVDNSGTCGIIETL